MGLNPTMKQRIAIVLDASRFVFQWGFIPAVLFLGFNKGADPGMPELTLMKNEIYLVNIITNINMDGIPEDIKRIYKTAWEMPQKTILEMAAARGPFIDQSQCLNVHVTDPLDKLTSMHHYAWEMGLKSSIYHLKTEGSVGYTGTKMGYK